MSELVRKQSDTEPDDKLPVRVPRLTTEDRIVHVSVRLTPAEANWLQFEAIKQGVSEQAILERVFHTLWDEEVRHD